MPEPRRTHPLAALVLVACASTAPAGCAPDSGRAAPASDGPERPVATADAEQRPAPADPERLVVPSDDGHPLTVWAKRPASPRGAVLLLHGRTWSSLPDFDLRLDGENLSLMDPLVDAGFAVYALDARGYGGTPRDSTGWLTPDRMAEDVAAVLRWMSERGEGDARPALFGWSMGSTVAHLTAQRHPDLVSGVVLFGYWRHPDLDIPDVEELGAPAMSPNTAENAASDFIVPGSISLRAIDEYVRRSLDADPVRVDLGRMHQFDALDPAALTMPVLVLQGEHDPIAPDSVQAALVQRLATGDRAWVTLPGCDHAAHLERCRPQFVDAMVEFLSRVMRTEPGGADRR